MKKFPNHRSAPSPNWSRNSRAERRAGELLKAKEKHRGFPDIVQSHDVTPPPKLEEIGISRKQSSRWQAIADIPEPVFEEHIARAKEAA